MALKNSLRAILKLQTINNGIRYFSKHSKSIAVLNWNADRSSRFLHTCIPLQKKQE